MCVGGRYEEERHIKGTRVSFFVMQMRRHFAAEEGEPHRDGDCWVRRGDRKEEKKINKNCITVLCRYKDCLSCSDKTVLVYVCRQNDF